MSREILDAQKANARTLTWPKSEWIWGSLLVLAVLICYLPVWRAGFAWDDFEILLKNKCLIGPLGLKEIWTTKEADICPLTWTTFYFEHALWGFAPRPYHVVNVVLHAASAVALWRVLLALEISGAWLGAMLWAIHPVQVESVAWVIELKNTQSALFFLLSILFFLKWLKMGQPVGIGRNFGLMLLCALLAMASKSSTVILPVVFCLAAWWMQRRFDPRILVRLIPVFLFSVAAGLLSLWTQQQALMDNHWVRTWPQRIVTSGDAIWFYLGKLIWPHPVITIYPRWHIDAGAAVSYLPFVAALVVLVVLALSSSGWARPWFMAYAYFLIALLPALGLLDNIIFRYSLVFDHLQYLASMGPLAFAGAGMFELGQRFNPAHPRWRTILGGGMLALLAVLTWQRARTFQSDETLWAATLSVNPDSWAATNNLGFDAFKRGDNATAEPYFLQAIATEPFSLNPYQNLIAAYQKDGRTDDVIAVYREALRLFPHEASLHFYLGKELTDKGLTADGAAELKEASRLDPQNPEAPDALGTIYLRKGQVDEAIALYQQALGIDDKFALAHYNLGLALAQKGQLDAAIGEYQQSIALDPTNGDVHNNLGTALAQKGQIDPALAEFQQAVALNPKNSEARRNLGTAYFQKGQLDAAIEQFNAALDLIPNDAMVHTLIGLCEGRKGNIPGALAEFREALRLKPGDPTAQHYLSLIQAPPPAKAK